MPSSSGSISSTGRTRMIDPEEALQPLETTKPLTQQHNTTSQKNRIFSNIVVRTTTLATFNGFTAHN
jgi:hypothetical protein